MKNHKHINKKHYSQELKIIHNSVQKITSQHCNLYKFLKATLSGDSDYTCTCHSKRYLYCVCCTPSYPSWFERMERTCHVTFLVPSAAPLFECLTESQKAADEDGVHLKLFSVKMHNYTNLQKSFSPETVAALCILVVYLLVRFMWLHLCSLYWNGMGCIAWSVSNLSHK